MNLHAIITFCFCLDQFRLSFELRLSFDLRSFRFFKIFFCFCFWWDHVFGHFVWNISCFVLFRSREVVPRLEVSGRKVYDFTKRERSHPVEQTTSGPNRHPGRRNLDQTRSHINKYISKKTESSAKIFLSQTHHRGL